MNRIFCWLASFSFLLLSISLVAQPAQRWQQAISYQMDIDFDVNKHQFKGKQKIKYTNNSPDELDQVFYHLYFNAFQPGSMMDIRSQNIVDPDHRVGGRIGKLKPHEIGYLKVKKLKMNGKEVKHKTEGTILEVSLPRAIKPGETVELNMDFEGQVPLQIRRSGRDSKEGIAYSMAQWYPKLSEYDYQGWHANPYVSREFHGVWGDFDVKINIDKNYIIGGTGVLQNAKEIGYGYSDRDDTPVKKDKIKWHFKAENVHDFMWAADPDYTHIKYKAENGPMLHFFFQKSEKTEENWMALPMVMEEAFAYINKHYGKYPYSDYAFLQGGDGGMEYPMATLITGERTFPSLVGVSVHEVMHSWYQMMLGSNESLYAWMDEGFTSFASGRVIAHLSEKGLIPGVKPNPNPMASSYASYGNFAQSGLEEPLSTHADHFNTNTAYSIGSYNKGAVFLAQLEYVMGKKAFDQGLLDYFETWKFKHPNPNDFIRVMEKASGLELDWYKEYMVYTTKTIDYGVQSVEKKDRKNITITLERFGQMPMPVDVTIVDRKGNEQIYHIPLRIMRGEKPAQPGQENYHIAQEDWPWTHPTYSITIPMKWKKVKSVKLNANRQMADLNRDNDTWEKEDN